MSNAQPPTTLCLTVDTEFSIGGAFSAPFTARPVGAPFVWCPVQGQSQGLAFLLATLRRYRQTATFFIEALQSTFFGAEEMRPAVEAIAAEGHALELHLHPAWTVFAHPDWPARVAAQARQDDMAGRTAREVAALIERGQQSFAAWGLPSAQWLRTGSLQHDDAVYEGAALAGLRGCSNIGIGIWQHPDPRYALFHAARRFSDVQEIPVTSYTADTLPGFSQCKTLTLQGSSCAELRYLLQQARRQNLRHLVLLTHPFEFVRRYDSQMQGAKTHRFNQQKLAWLCEHVAQHPDQFCFGTLNDVVTPDDTEAPDVCLHVPRRIGLPRLCANKLMECLP